MSRLNLPPVPRKIVKQENPYNSPWARGFGLGWHFTQKDGARFESMGLDAATVKQMTEDIGSPPRINLSQYIYSARLAGVDPKAFSEIAKSGVLSSPPPLTQLRLYLAACNKDPLLAMLALRARLTPKELTDLAADGELTVQNLRAMIDLGSAT